MPQNKQVAKAQPGYNEVVNAGTRTGGSVERVHGLLLLQIRDLLILIADHGGGKVPADELRDVVGSD